MAITDDEIEKLIEEVVKYPRGALNYFFFSGRGVQPGFPKCGAWELIFASEKRGLGTENFHIWGLVN